MLDWLRGAPSRRRSSALAGGCVALMAAAACVGDDPAPSAPPTTPTNDAGTTPDLADAKSPGDGSVQQDAHVPGCDPAGAFDESHAVPGLAEPGREESSARFSPDELTAFVGVLQGVGGADIHGTVNVATRATTGEPFGKLTPLTFYTPDGGTLSGEQEFSPSISSDGTVLIFEHGSEPASQLFASVHDPINPPPIFENAVPLSGPAGAGGPYLLPDNTTVYFRAITTGADTTGDLYRGQLKGSGLINVAPVEGVNTPAVLDARPVVTGDDLTLYWGSTRTDVSPEGGVDIYVATRASTSETFSNVRNVAKLNTSAAEVPLWISPDGCRLYYLTTAGDDPDIYVATRTPK